MLQEGRDIMLGEKGNRGTIGANKKMTNDLGREGRFLLWFAYLLSGVYENHKLSQHVSQIYDYV